MNDIADLLNAWASDHDAPDSLHFVAIRLGFVLVMDAVLDGYCDWDNIGAALSDDEDPNGALGEALAIADTLARQAGDPIPWTTMGPYVLDRLHLKRRDVPRLIEQHEQSAQRRATRWIQQARASQ